MYRYPLWGETRALLYMNSGPSLMDPMQVIIDSCAKRVLVPIKKKRQFLDVTPSMLKRIDSILYCKCPRAITKVPVLD